MVHKVHHALKPARRLSVASVKLERFRLWRKRSSRKAQPVDADGLDQGIDLLTDGEPELLRRTRGDPGPERRAGREHLHVAIGAIGRMMQGDDPRRQVVEDTDLD